MARKYTIVIPTMNGGHYLKHAIDSVLLEKSNNFQLIVSINHSTDNSIKILESYNDNRLKVVSPPRKLSMAGHYEWCIDQVESEWFTIMGDDDGVMPGFIMYLDYLTNKWKEVEAISFKRAYFFWPGAEKIFGDIVLHYQKDDKEKLLSTNVMLLKVLSSTKEHYDLPQLYTNNIVKKSLIEKIKLKSNGKFYHEMTPDVYSGVAIALSIKNYLKVSRPIFWTGSSPKSLGVAIANREQNNRENFDKDKSDEHFSLAKEEGLGISKEINRDLYKKSDLSLVIYVYSALKNIPFKNDWNNSEFIKSLVFSSALAKNILPNSLNITSKNIFFSLFNEQINQTRMNKYFIYFLFVIIFNIILFNQIISLIKKYSLKIISYFIKNNKLIYIKKRKNLDTITDANNAL